MRWLILPDIHDKIRRANEIIEREPHDHPLLMGDFFDDFQTGVTDAADTAKQVKNWLNASNTNECRAVVGVVRVGILRDLVSMIPDVP